MRKGVVMCFGSKFHYLVTFAG